MLVVKVELHHATQPGKITEIARMHICNVGGTADKRNYLARILRGRSTEDLNKATVNRTGEFQNFPSERVHVWNLILVALLTCGYRGYDG